MTGPAVPPTSTAWCAPSSQVSRAAAPLAHVCRRVWLPPERRDAPMPADPESYSAVAALNRAIRRYAQLGRRQQRQERGAVLERLLKEEARAFYQRYRARSPRPPAQVSSEISVQEWQAHFSALLGAAPAPHAAASDTDAPVTAGIPARSRPPLPQSALDAINRPFDSEEVLQKLKRGKTRKSVVGPVKPILAQAVAKSIVPTVTSLYNAFVRNAALPFSAAVSALTPILKHGGNPTAPGDYRGIAVGTLLSKIYASVLTKK